MITEQELKAMEPSKEDAAALEKDKAELLVKLGLTHIATKDMGRHKCDILKADKNGEIKKMMEKHLPYITKKEEYEKAKNGFHLPRNKPAITLKLADIDAGLVAIDILRLLDLAKSNKEACDTINNCGVTIGEVCVNRPDFLVTRNHIYSGRINVCKCEEKYQIIVEG